MKYIIIACLLSGICLWSFNMQAQSAVAKDTEWLEKELNTLAKSAKKSTVSQQYDFNECSCKYSAKANDDGGGFNLDKNFTFNLNEINNITYVRNEDKTYELRMKMKTDSDIVGFLNLDMITTTLYTSDENKVKEIVNKLRTTVKTCSPGSKSAQGSR
ncbi:hypothetical protein GXP67_05075 [Rhodocytophaga rosea]|uniref:DUF4468 domain-containing protein n=1 Tax=Rhodocytophaga rosea TaxID=2704465 RepID=A0A6C0GE75_9BACT|nr:hypothetical protein [Rhodocytophaga rosea]QHT66083.1 hypothetical protein GXP67_05075 [Rhodocytophaga rosea]